MELRGGCGVLAVVQPKDAGICYLVTAAVVIAKNAKIMSYLKNEDRKFINRVVETTLESKQCPLPPARLRSAYTKYSAGRELMLDGGNPIAVVEALFTTNADPNKNVKILKAPYAYHSPPLGPDDPKLTLLQHLRLHRQYFSNIAQQAPLALMQALYSQDLPAFSSNYGKTLSRLCGTNDSIIGGFVTVVRRNSKKILDAGMANRQWSRIMLVRKLNKLSACGPAKKAANKNKNIDALRRDLKKMKAYDDNHWAGTEAHAMGFTVCHEKTKRLGKGLPDITICNWNKCYKASSGYSEDSFATFHRNLQGIDAYGRKTSASKGAWRLLSVDLIFHG